MPSKTLAPCPDKPNCVSSEAETGPHYIEPFLTTVEPDRAWQALQTVVSQLARTQIKTVDDTYLHAETKSRWFGFVDDVEFLLQPEKHRIAVRSASRTGYTDLGVNRRRLETIRKMLQQTAVIG
jgi:uncharacterized protein (DUF1499 family)